jgi:hypothetical protein
MHNQITKTRRVVMDSRSRNLEAYPDPSSYELTLYDDMINVSAVRLLVADVPFPAPLVAADAAPLPLVLLPGTEVSAPLARGDYDAAGLALMLGANLSAASGAPFSVSSGPATGVLRFSAPQAFSIGPVRDAVLARLLGFRLGSSAVSVFDADSGQWTASSEFKACLERTPYLVLRLSPNAEVILSPGDALHRAFAVIPAPHRRGSVRCGSTDKPFEKRWNPPLARIARLQVQLTDPDGQPYDFQNQDHRIELEFDISARPTWQ